MTTYTASEGAPVESLDGQYSDQAVEKNARPADDPTATKIHADDDMPAWIGHA